MRERFGKLVLLHETEVTPLGSEYRAAKLSATGLEKIVSILRLKPEISMQPEPARRLMDQAKGAAQLQNPAILKILGIGKVEQSYYISYEFVLGKSLQQILDRCKEEQFPFAPDHALFIAAKTCSALEHAHGRRSDAGARMFHGMLSPFCVSVSYDGDVKVKGFEFWQAHLREAGLLSDACLAYLAPEQGTAQGDTRSDIYSLGLILLEMLTGQRPAKDAFARLSSSRLASPQGDDDSLPKPILEILQKALAPDPNSRYAEISEMRKALDTLLFSGDFSPTTFNVAFFMHSLFRDDSDREQQAVAQERELNYAEFLTEEGRTPPGGTAPATVIVPPAPAPAPAPPPAPPPAPRVHVPPPAEVVHVSRAAHLPSESHPPTTHVVRGASESHPPPSPPSKEEPSGLSAEDAAAGFTFHKEEPKGKGGLIAAVVVVLLLGGGGAAFYFLKMRPAATAPVAVATPDPAVLAAQQKVRELEERLAQMQAEKTAEEEQAANEAKDELEKKARQRGQAADPAAIQRAQDEARERAAAAAIKRQQEETRRIEEERKAEEARLAQLRREQEEAAKKAADDAAAKKAADDAAAKKAADDAAAKKAAAATPTPTAVPTPTPVQPGALVNVTDPGVVRPVGISGLEQPPYPPMAKLQRIQGDVELSLLIDDKGAVADVKVVKGVSGKWGLNEAAVAAARRRKYRAATKNGVSVKVWIPITYTFKL